MRERSRRLQADRDAARSRSEQDRKLAEQLERQLASCSCRGRRVTSAAAAASGGWAEKNSDEDSGKHSDNSLSQSEPGWLSSSRYSKVSPICSRRIIE